MGCLRPATPGFLVTLAATLLLAVVSFSVPWFKSIFFLKASLSFENKVGFITFGTLGYCIEVAGDVTCSKPTIGYTLNINGLVGNKLPVQIPETLIKWLTYALVLHIVALLLAAGSAVLGLLAHVREMAMTCFSTCISGFAATVAFLAFVFDIALFEVAKTRINKVPGGSAVIGNAIWLTLASCVLLFFSGCFYTLGRCCISNRSSDKSWGDSGRPAPVPGPQASYGEQMRLDAVKAEADRKARQKKPEGGLPVFPESTPLKARIDGDEVYVDEDESQSSNTDINNLRPRQPSPNPVYGSGYVQGPPGGRAVDQYYAPSNNQGSLYPPKQPSQHSAANSVYAASTYSAPNYAASNYRYNPSSSSPPPATNNAYLSPNQQYVADRYANISQDYGHTAGGTTYHTAASHQPYASTYSQYETFESPAQAPLANPYVTPAQQLQSPYETYDRNYTLGGTPYGSHANTPPTLPTLPEQDRSQSTPYFAYPGESHTTSSPPPIDTQVSYRPQSTSPVKGPRSPRSPVYLQHDEPPSYDAGPSQPPGAWGAKHPGGY